MTKLVTTERLKSTDIEDYIKSKDWRKSFEMKKTDKFDKNRPKEELTKIEETERCCKNRPKSKSWTKIEILPTRKTHKTRQKPHKYIINSEAFLSTDRSLFNPNEVATFTSHSAFVIVFGQKGRKGLSSENRLS